MTLSTLSWDGIDSRVVSMLAALQRFGDTGPGAASADLDEHRATLATFLLENVEEEIGRPCAAATWTTALALAQYWADATTVSRPMEADTAACVRRIVGDFAAQSGMDFPLHVALGDMHYEVLGEREVRGPMFARPH